MIWIVGPPVGSLAVAPRLGDSRLALTEVELVARLDVSGYSIGVLWSRIRAWIWAGAGMTKPGVPEGSHCRSTCRCLMQRSVLMILRGNRVSRAIYPIHIS